MLKSFIFFSCCQAFRFLRSIANWAAILEIFDFLSITCSVEDEDDGSQHFCVQSGKQWSGQYAGQEFGFSACCCWAGCGATTFGVCGGATGDAIPLIIGCCCPQQDGKQDGAQVAGHAEGHAGWAIITGGGGGGGGGLQHEGKHEGEHEPGHAPGHCGAITGCIIGAGGGTNIIGESADCIQHEVKQDGAQLCGHWAPQCENPPPPGIDIVFIIWKGLFMGACCGWGGREYCCRWIFWRDGNCCKRCCWNILLKELIIFPEAQHVASQCGKQLGEHGGGHVGGYILCNSADDWNMPFWPPAQHVGVHSG